MEYPLLARDLNHWNPLVIATVPKMPEEKSEELDELEVANKVSGNTEEEIAPEGSNNKQYKGITRPCWTPQRGLKVRYPSVDPPSSKKKKERRRP
jgi:hypothetical protein